MPSLLIIVVLHAHAIYDYKLIIISMKLTVCVLRLELLLYIPIFHVFGKQHCYMYKNTLGLFPCNKIKG